jgi:Transposase DDE domain group 1
LFGVVISGKCLSCKEDLGCRGPDRFLRRKALEVKLPDAWSRATAVFDDGNLVSFAGLAPVLGLAERAGLGELVAERVRFKTTKLASAGVNPAGKLTGIVAGMAAGADCIDDLDVIRCGGMRQLFTGVYAGTTLGQFLREFTHGHSLQLASVLRAHLVNLIQHSRLLPGREQRVFVDIDSLLRPVFGRQKQGASFGFTKIAGKEVLRRGLSPLVTTLSTEDGAPVIAGVRLRAGRAGSGKGAASMVRDAVRTARAAGGVAEILVRGDCAYANSAVINACQKAGARFSFALIKSPAVAAAIASIPEHAWMPVHYPDAVINPQTGELISDAQVAEIAFTAFTSTKTPVPARLIVRRVRDRARADELFPVWRHHPFFTNSSEPTADADLTHRQHAIIETVFADLIDGPLAHLPSGQFAANTAWATCAAITHNLLRAAGTLASARHATARGATLRRQLIAVPARLARPQRRPLLHLPAHWPWANQWTTLWTALTGPPTPA